jgi:hypothetical protein
MTIYEQLGTIGNVEQQVLCRKRVEELEPSLIQYCKYKSSGSGVQKEELSELSNQEGPGMDILQSKLEVSLGPLLVPLEFCFSLCTGLPDWREPCDYFCRVEAFSICHG